MNRGIVREDEDYMPEPGDTFRIDIRDYWGGREEGEKEKKKDRCVRCVIETLLFRVS